ncbi:MAG: dTMP kinase [Bacteroidetes bacterium]|nr:dTMP kinase [Bacteroidota bacterium]
MQKGLFIAFEGIDGCGKSTQLKLLCDALEKKGHKVYPTCEPTGSPIGSLIRDIFGHRMEADHRVIAGLFVADRLHHILNKTDGLLKKLEEGYTVVCDRYYLSSYAYQGVHMPLDWVIEANSLSAALLKPDLHIFLDISPEISMDRIQNGRNSVELYETRENLQKVRDMYFKAMSRLEDKEVFFVTNGNRNQDDIARDIWSEVLFHLTQIQ